MKKLLLAILPLLLLFGVGFAENFFFNISSISVSTAQSNPDWIAIAPKPGQTVVIDTGYIIPGSLMPTTPKVHLVVKENNTTTFGPEVATTFPVVNADGSFTINFTLTGGRIYMIGLSNSGASWTGKNYKIANDPMMAFNSGFVFLGQNQSSIGTNTFGPFLFANAAGNNIRVRSGFSFTYTQPTTTTTIRYNGILSTGFAGSNIYLEGINSTVAMSGTDIKFTYLQNIFRALFRSH